MSKAVSVTGCGAGYFLGRPRRRLGVMSLTGGANHGETCGRGAGCETVAVLGRPRRLRIGDEDDGRAGASSTSRSILSGRPYGISGAWAGSRGGVSGPTGGPAVTGTGKTRGWATTGASLVALGSSLPEYTSPACKGKMVIGLI